jgi:outer membrane protein insertion porin family
MRKPMDMQREWHGARRAIAVVVISVASLLGGIAMRPARAGELLDPLIPAAPDSLLAAGATVLGWDYGGARGLSPMALDRVVEDARGRPLRRSDLDRALAEMMDAYREAGYLHAEVRSVTVRPAGAGVRIVVGIEAGAPVILGHVEVLGNELYDDADICQLLALETGKPFSHAAFESGVEDLLDRYENAGRPFAAVELRDVSWGERVTFTLAVREGQPVSVDGLRVEGNKVTKPEVIERLSGLREGAPFAQHDLERAAARLERSGLFAGVEPLELVQGADRTRNEVLIRVREGRSNLVSGAVGYGGQDIGWTGLFDLTLGNLMGSGRRAHARWEGRGQGVELYELAYAEPWILGSPVTAHFDLARTIQDTLYTQSLVAITGEVAILPELSLNTGWEREATVQSASSIAGTARNALVVGTAWDLRDMMPYPTRGFRIAADVHLARKKLRYAADFGGEDTFGSFILEGEIERAQRLGRRWVAIVRGRGEGIRSQEAIIPYYELFPLGGAESLRGYREEQFRGAHVELLQFEQHYLMGPDNSRLIGFVDVGHVSTKGTVLAVPGEQESIFRFGYGAGIRLETRLGLIGVDYGLGEGDGPLDGKLHLALKSAF